MTAAGDDADVLPELDPVIHAQARLRVMVALATLEQGDEIIFPRLRDLLGMTAGNLSTHLRKLEDAGYVQITKAFQRRTPVTYVGLTSRGRLAFETYTAALQTLLASNHGLTARPADGGRGPDQEGDMTADARDASTRSSPPRRQP